MASSSRPLRVTVLTQWIGVKMQGPSGGLAPTLISRGCEVEVVAGSHPAAEDGRQVGIKREVIDGVEVARYPYFRSHDRSVLRRAATFLSFAGSTSVMALPRLAAADVVLVYATPATAATAALAARKFRGTPYVLLVQDVWPDSMFAAGFIDEKGLGRWVLPPVEGFVNSTYRAASAVVGISQGMRDLLVDRGCQPEKTTYVYNSAPEVDIPEPVVVPERVPGTPLHLMYAGNLGGAQGLDGVLRAIALIPPGDVRLTFVGEGTEKQSLMDLARQLKLDNVHFVPRVSRAELHELMAEAHVHLVALTDSPIFEVTIPSKLQSLLASGVPILVSARGAAAQLVDDHRAGLSCPPEDAPALAEAIRQLAQFGTEELRAMGIRGRELYFAEMSEKINGDRLMAILEWAATPPELRVGTVAEARDGRIGA